MTEKDENKQKAKDLPGKRAHRGKKVTTKVK